MYIDSDSDEDDFNNELMEGKISLLIYAIRWAFFFKIVWLIILIVG